MTDPDPFWELVLGQQVRRRYPAGGIYCSRCGRRPDAVGPAALGVLTVVRGLWICDGCLPSAENP